VFSVFFCFFVFVLFYFTLFYLLVSEMARHAGGGGEKRDATHPRRDPRHVRDVVSQQQHRIIGAARVVFDDVPGDNF
jgi:hypothetical protein